MLDSAELSAGVACLPARARCGKGVLAGMPLPAFAGSAVSGESVSGFLVGIPITLYAVCEAVCQQVNAASVGETPARSEFLAKPGQQPDAIKP